MNKATAARWASRLLAVVMLVAFLVGMKIMESQLRKLGGASGPAPPVPTTTERTSPLVEVAEGEERLPEEGDERDEEAGAVREDEIPKPGEIPESAVW